VNKLQQLKSLHAKKSKHSNYQILSNKLQSILPQEKVYVNSRYEQERLEYIINKVDLKDKTIIDIGGNTGFFSFEAIDYGAKHVHYFEGNSDHANFVRIASDYLNITPKLKITNNYYNFSDTIDLSCDIVFLLNVLHHTGDDYGNASSIDKAKEQILSQLLSLNKYVEYIIFQIGFNWKGNTHLCLFDNGTKKELIDFVKTGVEGFYTVENIGIAENENNHVTYKDMYNNNVTRDDSLGEFLNRPLFILKSIK